MYYASKSDDFNFVRYEGEVTRPSQVACLHASCGLRTEPEWNEHVERVHYGEDGPGLAMVRDRTMFIGEQALSGDLQEWAMWEHYEDAFLDDDGEGA